MFLVHSVFGVCLVLFVCLSSKEKKKKKKWSWKGGKVGNIWEEMKEHKPDKIVFLLIIFFRIIQCKLKF